MCADLRKRGANLWVRYRITLASFEAMQAKNKGKCEVCGVKPGDVVDHCHSTGAVRGLVCRECNVGLARLGDCVDGVRNALRYLQRHKRRSSKHPPGWKGRIGNVREIAVRRPLSQMGRNVRAPKPPRGEGDGSVVHAGTVQQPAARPDAAGSRPKHRHPGSTGRN